jgi:hypothetical protein
MQAVGDHEVDATRKQRRDCVEEQAHAGLARLIVHDQRDLHRAREERVEPRFDEARAHLLDLERGQSGVARGDRERLARELAVDDLAPVFQGEPHQ